MLNFIKEQELWKYLKNAGKPIYLYGMGDGALKIINALKQKDVELAGVFASDEYVRGHSFEGFLVEKLSQVKSRGEFIALLSFATEREPLLSRLFALSEEIELYAPDVPVFDDSGEIFDMQYLNRNCEQISKVYELLADDKSKRTFEDILNFKLSGKVRYLKECESDKSEVYTRLIKPDKNDVYIDLGGYDGDTLFEISEYARPKRAVIFEPDKKNFEKLKRNLKDKNLNEELYMLGAWSGERILRFAGGKGGRNSHLDFNAQNEVCVNSVDNILNGERADIIKFDVEGAEKQAIVGCEKTIIKYKPRLMISAYHKNEDIFSIPLEVLKIRNDYKVFLRHHPYIPAWETNYYFI